MPTLSRRSGRILSGGASRIPLPPGSRPRLAPVRRPISVSFILCVRALHGARLQQTTQRGLPSGKATQREPTTRRRDKKGGPGAAGASPARTARTRSSRSTTRTSATLRRFISERGKIRSRRITGACRRHQSQVARAVKRARELALLPYVAEPATSARAAAVATAIATATGSRCPRRSSSGRRVARRAGAVVDVSTGYLRNYLIPRKLAQPATKGALDAAAQRAARPPSAPQQRGA